MMRTPEQCPFRESLGLRNRTEAFCCNLARQTVGLGGKEACRVRRDACDACCRSALPSPGHINSVVASLVFEVSARILREGNAPAQEVQEAARAQRYFFGELEVVS